MTRRDISEVLSIQVPIFTGFRHFTVNGQFIRDNSRVHILSPRRGSLGVLEGWKELRTGDEDGNMTQDKLTDHPSSDVYSPKIPGARGLDECVHYIPPPPTPIW